MAVENSISIAGCLRLLNRAPVGSNYKWIKKQIADLGVSTLHWKGQSHGTTRQPKMVPEQVLVVNSNHATGPIKRMILREKLLPYHCAKCGTPPMWNGRPLTLRLDHINGVRDDHRIDNLRFLCPNCDSQSETFCGRNKRTRAPSGFGSRL